MRTVRQGEGRGKGKVVDSKQRKLTAEGRGIDAGKKIIFNEVK